MGEMIKICVITLFFCSIAGRHVLIQTELIEDRGQDYRDKFNSAEIERMNNRKKNKTGVEGMVWRYDADGVGYCQHGSDKYQNNEQLPQSLCYKSTNNNTCISCYCSHGRMVPSIYTCGEEPTGFSGMYKII